MEWEDMEKKWANDTVSEHSVDALADFLGGNPMPTFGILDLCSDDHLAKAIQAVIVAVRTLNEELAEEIVGTSLRALACRVENDDSRMEKLVAAIVVAIRLDVSHREIEIDDVSSAPSPSAD